MISIRSLMGRERSIDNDAGLLLNAHRRYSKREERDTRTSAVTFVRTGARSDSACAFSQKRQLLSHACQRISTGMTCRVWRMFGSLVMGFVSRRRLFRR